MKDQIDENEAAILLGITKELLYSFVKTGVKGQKLVCISRQGHIFYARETLEAWDAFLKSPWAIPGTKRSEIPLAVKDYLKAESRGQCMRCGNGHRLDYAHIEPWNTTYSHHPHNLIRLCTDCHVKFDDGIIPVEEIRQLKQKCITSLKSEILSSIGLAGERFFCPPMNPHFLGRSKELDQLSNLFKANHCVAIDGVGGIGKTQLILQFLHKENLKSDWFNLEKFSSLVDFQVALTNHFAAFSLAEISDILNASQSVLVLDGFETLLNNDWDASVNFVSELCQCATSAKILVTSQIDFADILSGAAFMKINDGLSIQESRSIFAAYLPEQDVNDNSLNVLISFADGHPLTLVILASLIQFYKAPSHVLEALEHAGAAILENPKRKQQNRTTSLDICLNLSYGLLALEQKCVLQYIALFPAGYKTVYLEALTQGKTPYLKNKKEVQRCLVTLDQFNFLQHLTDPLNYERVNMLKPIRVFVMKKADEKQTDFLRLQVFAYENLMLEAVTIYENYMLSDRIEFGLLRFDLDLPNYVNAFKKCVQRAFHEPNLPADDRKQYLNLITGFTAGLYKYLFTRGYFEYGIFFNAEGARAHQALGEYDLAIEDLLQVGTLLHRRYRLQEAADVLIQLKKLEKCGGIKSPTVRLLEGQLVQPKEPAKAILIFKEGLSLIDKLIRKRKYDVTLKVNRANILMEIGKSYEMFLHDYQSALPYYEECYQIQQEAKDYGNLYCTSHHLGNAYAGLSQFEKSLSYYKESLRGFIQLGQSQYISNSFAEIGRLRVPNPELDYTFIDDDIAAAGLEDIGNEIKLSFGYGRIKNNNRNGNLPTEVVNKLWNIIKAVSLSNANFQLKEWAAVLSQWLEAQLKEKILVPPLPWFFLKMAELSAVVRANPADLIALQSLKQCCYLYGSEADNDIIDPYGWLALWLREQKIEPFATSDGLLAEIENDSDEWDENDEF